MSPLLLEKSMMSLVSSSLMVRTIGALLHEYPYTLRWYLPRDVSSTGTHRRPCTPHRSQRSRNAVVQLSVDGGSE
jgi:hypothetical protein